MFDVAFLLKIRFFIQPVLAALTYHKHRKTWWRGIEIYIRLPVLATDDENSVGLAS